MAQPKGAEKGRGSTCLDCGGTLSYDSALRHFICRSCGLTYTDQQLMVARDKIRDMESPAEQRRRKQNEYLNWWLSKK